MNPGCKRIIIQDAHGVFIESSEFIVVILLNPGLGRIMQDARGVLCKSTAFIAAPLESWREMDLNMWMTHLTIYT